MTKFDEQAREIYSHSVSTGTSMIDAIAAALRAEHERASKMQQALEMCINNPITAYELSVARAAIREYEEAPHE